MALGVNENYFDDKFDRQASVCRIIRYPAVKEAPLPGQFRAGTHSDYGIMGLEPGGCGKNPDPDADGIGRSR